ncbi:MAG TPA: hypothetical protein PLI31_08750 [Methanoregulaceae archaeon]|nr:hypothetical protein [Methanoregulaceae archaeon]
MTLALSNLGPEDVRIEAGDRIVQILFAEVMENHREYRGRYQDSTGAVAAREP